MPRLALQEYTLRLPEPDCIGVIIEFENAGLGKHFNLAFYPNTHFCFIGYSPKGLDLRVSYFDGVPLQTPEQVKRACAAAQEKATNIA